ncbi:unnamed protein product [Trichobilharzia regenti]|nr:unnamed protein product [Trichobilharzia regenti]
MTTVDHLSNTECTGLGEKYYDCNNASHTCVFTNYLNVCWTKPDSVLCALNKIETALNSLLSHKDICNDICSCITANIERLISALVFSLSSEDILCRRSATQNLRLILRVALFSLKLSRLDGCVNSLIRHGLSLAIHSSVRLSLCAALPQIFTADLFHSYNRENIAQDFEPLLRSLVDCFISSLGNKSAYKYAFVSLLKMFGEDFCAFLHDTWQCKTADGVLSSAHLKLFHRWSNGILLTNKENNVGQNSIHHSIYPLENSENLFQISSLKSSAPTSMTSSDCIQTGACIIRYEDVCQLLSKSTFIQLVGHFKRVNNKPEKDAHVIHQAAEEILKTVVSRINASSRRGTIFEYFFLEKSSKRELSQNRPLICLMELLKVFIRTSNLNVILCSLEVATLLTHSLQCAGSESDSELMNRDFTFSFSDSEWFTRQLLSIICFALSDSNLVVRVAGTKLSLAAGSLPFSAMIIVRELAGGVLTYHDEYNTEEPKNEIEFTNYEFPVSKIDLLHKEAVDLITTLLLTFPSSEFDLAEVCKLFILPGLTDLKLQVSCYVRYMFNIWVFGLYICLICERF